jgi:hypothetical protein
MTASELKTGLLLLRNRSRYLPSGLPKEQGKGIICSKRKQESRGLLRRSRMFSIFLLLFAFFSLAQQSSRAQGSFTVEDSEWEAFVFFGGSFPGSSEHSTPVEGSSESRLVGLKYDAGWHIGGGIMNNRWSKVSAALEYSFSAQSATVTNLSDLLPSLEFNHSVHRITYNILYFPRGRKVRLQPYVFGGPGLSLFYVHRSVKDVAEALGLRLTDPWKFTMSLGGGTRYFLGSRIAAFFQFGDNISGVPGYGLPTSGRVIFGQYIPGFRPNGFLHNWETRGGIMFQLSER